MIKNIFTLIISVMFGFVSAQSVGIGTKTPNASAALDLDVSSLGTNAKKGLLIPRIPLKNTKDQVTIPNPAAGLMVYNTATTSMGTNDVIADNFYFWNGTQWIDCGNYEAAAQILQPQVYFIKDAVKQTLNASNLKTAGEVVTYSSGTEFLNSGNIITRNTTDNTFTINTPGFYELSGMIFYNPSGGTSPTDLDFIFQVLNSSGTWVNVSKTVSVWGDGTTTNSRSLIITPVVVNLNKNDILRAIVKTNLNAPSGPQINPPTGIDFCKALKIQKF